MKPIIGEIKEQVAQKPKAFPVVTRAMPAPMVILGKKPVKIETSSVAQRFVEETPSEFDSSSIIDNMSPDEIKGALEEINSLLSAKNIAFLKGEGKIKISEEERKIVEVPEVRQVLEEINYPIEDLDSCRYDLEGRRVIIKNSFVVEVSQYLMSESNNGTVEECQSIAMLLFDGIIACNLCLNYIENIEYPKELFNHEFSPDSPGYNMREICELFRSEYVQQRSIAIKMLQGIFMWRDFIVSLPAYYDVCSLHSTLSVNCDFRFRSLCVELAKVMHAMNKVSFKQNSWMVLVDILLKYSGTAKLPPSLPTLLVWSLYSKTPPNVRFSVLLTVLQYLRGHVEYEFQCVLWQGLWGSYGVPPLLTPHNKRSASSYEQYYADCLEKASSKPEKQDDNGGDMSGNDLNNEFILKCRWNRIAAFVDSELIAKLSSQIGQSTELLVTTITNQIRNGKPIDLSAYSCEISMGQICVDILCTAPPACDADILDVLYKKVVLVHNSIFNKLDDLVANNFVTLGKLYFVLEYLTGWWKFITEVSKWEPRVAHSFTRHHVSDNIVKKLKFVLENASDSETEHMIWCFRFLRVNLITCGLNDSIASLIETFNFDKLRAVSTNNEVNNIFNIEVFYLLEQVAVSFSSYLMENKSVSVELLHVCKCLVSIALTVANRLLNEMEEHALLVASAVHFLVSVYGTRRWNRPECFEEPHTDNLRNSIMTLNIRGMGLIPAIHCFNGTIDKSECITIDSEIPSVNTVYLIDKMNCINKPVEGLEKWFNAELFVALQRLLNSSLCIETHFHSEICFGVYTATTDHGLVNWQLGRLKQCSQLLKLQETILNQRDSLISNFEEIIVEFSDSMSGIFVHLFNAYLEYVLNKYRPEEFLEVQIDDLRSDVLNALLGISMPRPIQDGKTVQAGAFGVLLGGRIANNSFVSEWLRKCYTGQLPLSVGWQYECIRHMEGVSLSNWLKILDQNEQNSSSNDVGSKMYSMLKLVTIENCVKWSGSEDFVEEIAGSYVNVITRLIAKSVHSTEFCKSLLIAAQKHFFSVHSLVRHAKNPTTSTSGLLDLCDKVLECSLGMYIHPDVHGASLCCFLLPSLPVIIRTKVWKQLRDVQLVHLLDCSDFWKCCLNCFVWSQSLLRNEMAYLRTMLSAVITLRAAEDVKLCIVSVALFQISQCIFSDPSTDLSWDEPRGCLLLEIVKNTVVSDGLTVNITNEIVRQLLSYYTNFNVMEYHTVRLDFPKMNSELLERSITDNAEAKSLRYLLSQFRPELL